MFKKLFTISCNHNYFADGQCSDLQIEPTAICNTFLKRYKMLFRPDDLSIYSVLNQQVNSEAETPLPTSPLSFYILITSDKFYNYTKYPSIVSSADTTNHTSVRGNTLLFIGEDSGTNSSILAVSQVVKPPPLSFQNRKLYGIISITPPKVFCNYILTLEAIATKWRYYIVADKNVTDVDVKEKEKDSLGNGPERIIFNNVGGALQTDTIYEAIKTTFPNAVVFVKESDIEVQSVQKPAKVIQCWNTTDKNQEQLLMDNLPIPSCLDNGQKIIHVLSKNNNF